MEIINTLERGWNSDNDPIDQPKGTYRNMSNMNLITKNGNHFSAETQQGTIVSFSIPNYTDTVLFSSPNPRFTPIGFFSFIDKLIVMATHDESATGGSGIIGVVTIAENGIGTWDTLYYSEDLKFTKQHRLDGYALNETDAINRVYWCDDLNNPRVVNYTSTAYDSVASGTLIAGQQYIAVQGQIFYNGILYGIGETAGAIFTATVLGGTAYTATVNPSIPVGKVINYISVNSITIQPPATLGEIDYKETTRDGVLYAGMKAYTFRLKSDSGKVSSFCPISKPVHVTNTTPAASITGYQNYEGRGQGSVLVTTDASITITISDLPYTDFQFIEVVAVEYDQQIEVIRAITKIAETTITGSAIDIKHTGAENLGTFTIDELTAVETIIISAKTMATFKQRGFMANLTERAEFTSNVTADVLPFIYPIPADVTGGEGPKSYTYLGSENSALLNISVDGKYKVSNGDIEYPTGSGDTYGTVSPTTGTDVFIGVANETSWTVSSGTPDVTAIIRIRKYKAFNGGADVYKDIEVKDEYLDYKGEAVHHYLTGYWRDETYRIGFLGFDKYRQPFFVRWLDDIHIPSQSTSFGTVDAPSSPTTSDGGLINVYAGDLINPGDTTDNHAQTSLNIMGIQIDNLELDPEVIDKLDSFSIVRVKRDKQILTQGLMSPTAISADHASSAAPLATYDPLVDINCRLGGGTKDGTFSGFFTLKSPEITFLVSPLNSDLILQPNDLLSPVSRYLALEPYTDAASRTMEDPNGTGIYPVYVSTEGSAGANNQFFSKWYYHEKYVGNSGVINRFYSVGADSTITAADGTNDFVNRDAIIRNYATPSATAVHPLTPTNTAHGGTDTNWGASGGRSGLFITDEEDYINTSAAGLPQIWKAGENQKLLANWVRPKTILYNGQSDAAKALSEYLYCGHIQKIDAAFKADNYDAGTGKYRVSGIQVFGGDCLVSIYDTVICPYDDLTTGRPGAGFGYGVYFPCETTLNTVMRQGLHWSKNGLQVPATGVFYRKAGSSRPEDYLVNSAYSTTDELDFKYPALPLGFSGNGNFPSRARWSQQKNIGEVTDNQRIYLTNNFRDVDTNHGEINNLKVGADRLFYWQNKGVGYFPVNQQQLINSAIGGQVQLGVGGVLDRFDNSDIYFGNQHQWSLITTPDRFYWFDMRRKALCYLSFGGQVVEFSTLNGQQSFFNNRFTSIETISSPNIFDSDQPIMGRGISGWYDSRFETAYMTFKLNPTSGGQKYDFSDFTVSISKQLNEFIGQHSFVPGIAHEHNNHSLSVPNNIVGLLINTTYQEGDLVSFNGIIYVCLQTITTGGTVFNPPDIFYPGYFVAISMIDEINVHWRGDTAKFYGRVYDSYIEIVVTGQGQSVSFDNYEAYGNEFNFDNVTVNSSQLTGSDFNISASNRNYRYYDGSWKASYPLSTNNSRFFDKYIIVKFTKKNNFTGNIITSLNKPKRLVFLKSVIRPKK